MSVEYEKSANIDEQAKAVLRDYKVAIFIVAYNAEKHIEKVLNRIPHWVASSVAEIYVIDDHSKDNTAMVAQTMNWSKEFAPLKVYRTPRNQGYGGNQRLGYLYAIQKGFDIVVLLHGDGQYAPEALPHILAPYAAGADAVFGSRFLKSMGALRGNMPLYKWVGNRILTRVQNWLLKSKMSEMHSGYRSYRVSALKKVPFELNSVNFDFDADIIVQFIGRGLKIVEIPIPTYYGDEICHVNGVQYAWQCVKTAIKYRLMQFELFYDPKFDFRGNTGTAYTVKLAPTSLHYFIRELKLSRGAKILDVGGGNGEAVSQAHFQTGANVTAIDKYTRVSDEGLKRYQVDLDLPWEEQMPGDVVGELYDVVFALDVLEHLSVPEKGVDEIFDIMRSGGKLYASTGNIAFLPLRLMHLMGQFNYGRRGILDLTHRRLFTISTFKRMLETKGFKVNRVLGFGPPVADLGASKLAAFIDRVAYLLAQFWPSMWAFQILLECERKDSVDELMHQAFQTELAPEDFPKPEWVLRR